VRVCLLMLLLAMIAQPTRSGTSPDPLTSRQDPQSDEDAPADIQCGPVLVRGSDQFTRAELCQLLEAVSRNPLDSESRDSARDRVIKKYHGRGFLEADLSWKDAEKSADASAPAAILVITEGQVYRLRRLEMVGNENTRDRVIRRRVALDEGWPFDEELLDLSIKRINQLGIFEDFGKEDVGIKINRKGHYVDLVFSLKEKE
jgi:outer membrane protein assembly factor BamA